MTRKNNLALEIRQLEHHLENWQARGDEDWSVELTKLREHVLFLSLRYRN